MNKKEPTIYYIRCSTLKPAKTTTNAKRAFRLYQRALKKGHRDTLSFKKRTPDGSIFIYQHFSMMNNKWHLESLR